MLYPIKFKPTFHYRIWAGEKLKTELHKKYSEEKIGESWEISTVPNFVSEVENGFLKGKNLKEIIEIYKEELVGKSVWEKFGNEFPLLIKFLDAAEPLSVQVHPNDSYAKEKHNSFGKTEIWYVVDCEENSELIIGIKENISKEEFKKRIENGSLEEILNYVPVKKGDVFFIPAGRIHAIGKGITIAEIQQTSDITYRIYDFNRIDINGKKRDLHIEDAMNVSDFTFIKNTKTDYKEPENSNVEIIKCSYFSINKWNKREDFSVKFSTNTFRILMITEGKGKIVSESNEEILIQKGEVVLIPASLSKLNVKIDENIEILEIYV